MKNEGNVQAITHFVLPEHKDEEPVFFWPRNTIRSATINYSKTLKRGLQGTLHTPWNRGLLEKLTGMQLVKKFPAFYETRTFITAFTTAHHLSS
jgi:hypothetical protein